MRYTVVLPKRAQKDLDTINARHHDRVKAALYALSYNPLTGKKLEGEYRGYYSYRMWPYRIIYYIERSKIMVIIVRIGHRQGVYGS